MMTYLRIGQIVTTHGHRGELKIYPLTDDIQRFTRLDHVYLQRNGAYQRLTVQNARLHKGMVILALHEIPDMNEAEKLKGIYLELPLDELEALPEGSYYHFQIIGLEVYEAEKLLGQVTDILQTGSNDVYMIKTVEGKDLCLPALKSVVMGIDLEKNRMNVILPPGLTD